MSPNPAGPVTKNSDERPWGDYLVLADVAQDARPVAVKLITISPGQRTSLQTHNLRWEEWTALDDGLVATFDGIDTLLQPHVIHAIPLGTAHRLFNPTEKPARIVEVMYGQYREDDITRVEDDYGR